MSKTKTAIFICGPTAVGKTSIAIEIAKWLNTEIISFDSRQFYKELKIGAAPPSPQELEQVKHHLVGQLTVGEEYNAGSFEKDALTCLEQIFKQKDTAILAGGSGLYMKALTDGFDAMPQVDAAVREKYNVSFKEKGIESLQQSLIEKDPEYAKVVDFQNPQRLIRALEVIESTGKTYTSLRQANQVQRPFKMLKIGLNMEREQLYQRINQRVDIMLKMGLEEEARALLPHRDFNALQTVGYKEFFLYFDGQSDQTEAVEEIKKNSRRYAKRQLTWFRKDAEIQWFSPHKLESIQDYLKTQLQNG